MATTRNTTATSTLDFLQPMGEVQECWVNSTFLVVSKHQRAVIRHALSHKTTIRKNHIHHPIRT